jgi:hypothetical protein
MYLSIVIASRLDDYAGEQLIRFETFVNFLHAMSEKYWSKIDWELIVVDWNVVSEELQLKNLELLKKIKNVKHIQIHHDEAKNFYGTNNLPFRLYHALNRGYKESKGKYILSTNSDCFFSKEIFDFIGKKELRKKVVYLADRLDSLKFKNGEIHDINNRIINSANDIRDTCDNFIDSEGTLQRRHQKNSANDFSIAIPYRAKEYLKMSQLFNKYEKQRNLVGIWKKSTLKKSRLYLLQQIIMNKTENLIHDWICEFQIHTNACGDFILIDKKSLLAVGGYDENDFNMQHMDSDLIIRLIFNNTRHALFLPPAKILHWVTEGSGGTDTRYIEKRSYSELCDHWLYLFKK